MSQLVSTETIRRIYINKHSIEVGEHPDNPDDCLELRTVGDNIPYFGTLNLALLPEQAMALGRALMAAAMEKGAT